MVIPKPQQLEFLDWEFGVFFHFGIRTFYEGHKDWDMKEMPLEAFNPSELNCDRWMETIKAAGAKYAVLTCKHHDGFANWPSKYTEYSVKNTPWKNGKGDLVKEFTDSCRKYDIKVGLYYSPAEFGSVKKEAKEYDDYFINQISELLTNYGKIDYLWFDGCGSENHEYDTERIVKEIRKMQAEILIFNMWDPDTRWVGNEAGLAHYPNKNIVTALDFSVKTEIKQELDKPRFLPVECDCRMRLHNWFYSDRDEHTVKDVDELIGLYYYSVGRGANLLINIGPDRRGLLPEKDSEHLVKFGKEIKRRFSNPIEAKITGSSDIITIEFDQPQKVNHLILTEDLTNEEVVESFEIKAYPYSYGEPICVFNGSSVGHKAICSFPTIYTQKLQVHLRGGRDIRAKAYYIVAKTQF